MMDSQVVPPLPRQSSSRQTGSRRHDTHDFHLPSSSRGTRHASPSRRSQQPPSSALGADVISSLITSLDVVSKPTSPSSDRRPPSTSPIPSPVPKSPSPANGSFGVEYGAYSSPKREVAAAEDVSLDDLAACPPVIRTAKPPSGFSPLTAPKSPQRDPSGGVKSLLGGSRSASRPSSRGSHTSRDADTQSIGNLSVEPGEIPPIPDLKRRKSYTGSFDSWGKKQGRSMYMSSRDRLQDKEDKKRNGSGTAVGDRSFGSKSNPTSPHQDHFLAQIPINEESGSPSVAVIPPVLSPSSERTSTDSPALGSPRPIPDRNSSLRKTGPKQRSSVRRSATANRDSHTTKAIPEVEERSHSLARARSTSRTGRRAQDTATPTQAESDTDVYLLYSKMAALPERPRARSRSRSVSRPPDDRPRLHSRTLSYDIDIEEGAPSPAIAQRRRRERSLSVDKRGSRRESTENGRAKRSSSRLRRLSKHEGAPSPTADANHIGYERPPSADSIDDAVESYLCSPRLSQKIKHPQTGRVISFSEVGDSEGSAVFCCVGMGLTRYITAFYDELALTLKLRLITPDRPGVGDSEPYQDGTATPLSWPDDVYAICQALKITKFSILAHSAGAIYALATALRMPQHIRGRIHLLAPWIPPSQMSVFGASAQTPLPPSNAIPTSQRILRALPTPFLKAANSSFMTATSSSITSSLPKTPRKKRKNGQNVAKDREKEAAARSQAQQHQNGSPLPPPGVSDSNKENQLQDDDGERIPGLVRGDIPATGDMDFFRPSPMAGSAEGGVHKKVSSMASQRNAAAREAAVLAAAASAIADKERQATYDTRLTHAIWELATTGANPAVDLLVCLERRNTIGFRYVDITRPVIIHHGTRDTRVPVDNVLWLGKTMRRCEVRVLEGEGHGLMASASVMGGVLMEISKEWEDWTRITGIAARRTAAEREKTMEVGVAR
ncbi:hypothetical protein PpBr36_03532 [Pyricularia pennisetigena]|uniref:hypothetical protein n=1 Tax=Pyricularia pennisetigena TaxID=1578925 RepID=UPI00114DAEDF|nr:hypothetical protein PpBr36_03532 [Pyricularia pennisetigena]TLS30832.1 hypothetical protein PpBr36_03532 [Pyricularia pennisetigena]